MLPGHSSEEVDEVVEVLQHVIQEDVNGLAGNGLEDLAASCYGVLKVSCSKEC